MLFRSASSCPGEGLNFSAMKFLMQPISRISLIEEVDESTTPMDLVACGTGGVVPLAADVSVPVMNADARSVREKRLVRSGLKRHRRHPSSPPAR